MSLVMISHVFLRILGAEKLMLVCVEEWKRDIAGRQIPALFGGVGPLNSFVQFCKYM